MRKLLLVSASFAALTFTAGLSLADVVIEPEVDTWVMEQPDSGVVVDGDVVVGQALPDTVQIIEVPKHKKYGFVYLNKRRVLIDRDTHKVVKVYQ